MKDIIFRGKAIGVDRWVYGGYHKHTEVIHCPLGASTSANDSITHLIIRDGLADWELPVPIDIIAVNPETVSQYIGLNDKNGEKIFEGDILKFYHPNYLKNRDEIVRVEWMEQKAMFCIKDALGFAFHLSSANEKFYEIIGNIWDNPELLKEESE